MPPLEHDPAEPPEETFDLRDFFTAKTLPWASPSRAHEESRLRALFMGDDPDTPRTGGTKRKRGKKSRRHRREWWTP